MRRILSVLFVFFCVAIPSGQDPRAGTTPEQEAAQLQLRLQTREGRQELIRDRERLLRMMEQPECRPELIRNREMVREMLQDPGVRAGIREYEPMIREMERNREADLGIHFHDDNEARKVLELVQYANLHTQKPLTHDELRLTATYPELIQKILTVSI